MPHDLRVVELPGAGVPFRQPQRFFQRPFLGRHRPIAVSWNGRASSLEAHGANYEQAKPGTLRLIPSAERQPVLRRDYQAMRDMYLTEPVGFDESLAILTELEAK